MCHSRLFEIYESQLNRLVDEFDFLENKFCILRKERKTTLSLRLRKTPLVFHLRLNKFGLERIGLSAMLFVLLLELELLVSGIVGALGI